MRGWPESTTTRGGSGYWGLYWERRRLELFPYSNTSHITCSQFSSPSREVSAGPAPSGQKSGSLAPSPRSLLLGFRPWAPLLFVSVLPSVMGIANFVHKTWWCYVLVSMRAKKSESCVSFFVMREVSLTQQSIIVVYETILLVEFLPATDGQIERSVI